jgi:hypothetical protein
MGVPAYPIRRARGGPYEATGRELGVGGVISIGRARDGCQRPPVWLALGAKENRAAGVSAARAEVGADNGG